MYPIELPFNGCVQKLTFLFHTSFYKKPNLKAGHKGISDKFHIMRPNVDGLTIVVVFCAKGSVIVVVTAVQCRHHCTIKAIANNEY